MNGKQHVYVLIVWSSKTGIMLVMQNLECFRLEYNVTDYEIPAIKEVWRWANSAYIAQELKVPFRPNKVAVYCRTKVLTSVSYRKLLKSRSRSIIAMRKKNFPCCKYIKQTVVILFFIILFGGGRGGRRWCVINKLWISMIFRFRYDILPDTFR